MRVTHVHDIGPNLNALLESALGFGAVAFFGFVVYPAFLKITCTILEGLVERLSRGKKRA
jgi:hypothetical protein